MDGKNAAAPAGAPARPRGVFVAYAHEPEGRRIAVALVQALRARGCDVMFDDDVAPRNPVSVATWMDDEIALRIVICVLTPGYLQGDEPVVAVGAAKRKGVRYELRAIRQRIYDHEGRYGCPVIPVAPSTFPVESAPATLRGLEISRFDPENGSGTDQLVERIAELEGTGGIAAMSTTERTDSRQRFRQVVRELEEDLPAERAIALVRECLQLAEDPELSSDLVPAFPQLADVIKDHGQIRLMRLLTDRCFAALNSNVPLLHWERVLEARLLICGKAWYLQRDHRLQEALDHAQEGIRLAERYEARRTAAYGRQCVGRIQRLLAEDAQESDVDHYLSLSSATVSEAVALFHAIDGDRPRRSEAGACLSLGARTQLVRYRRLNDRTALAAADELAREADRMLTPDQKKDRHDLAILRAEIAAAGRRYSEARRRLGDVIESLIAERGALSEILARAYAARAHVAQVSRSGKAEVVSDLRKARHIFTRQQLGHAAATCDWAMLVIDPRTVTSVKMSRADIIELETLTADPRQRLAAVAKLAKRPDIHLARQRVDWAALVDRA
jgi:hypothetical protein